MNTEYALIFLAFFVIGSLVRLLDLILKHRAKKKGGAAIDDARRKEERTPRMRPEFEMRWGLTVREITLRLAPSLKMNRNAAGGLVVTNVAADSPAFKAGFRRGDVILDINGQNVRNIREFARTISENRSEDFLLILVERKQNTFYMFDLLKPSIIAGKWPK
jgi:predicted metalloprotease with PDZ domain